MNEARFDKRSEAGDIAAMNKQVRTFVYVGNAESNSLCHLPVAASPGFLTVTSPVSCQVLARRRTGRPAPRSAGSAIRA